MRTVDSGQYDIIGRYATTSSGILNTSKVTWSGSHGRLGALTNVSNVKVNKLTVDASHEHSSVGSGTSFNTMPPFIGVYTWKNLQHNPSFD